MPNSFFYTSVTKLRIVEFKCRDLVYIFAKGETLPRKKYTVPKYCEKYT